jgi:hypothetical protein
MGAEPRRNAALREIERHRSSFAQNLRQTVDVEDAEYRVLEHKNTTDKENIASQNAA